MDYVFDTDHCKRYAFPTHSNDLVIDRKDATVSEVFVVIVEPGKSVHLHAHPDIEQIFYFIHGNGILTVGTNYNEYPVRPGQVARIPPKTLHTVRAVGDKPVTYLCIDCFCNGRPADEPTWDHHVKTICREQGFNFNDITGTSAKGQ